MAPSKKAKNPVMIRIPRRSSRNKSKTPPPFQEEEESSQSTASEDSMPLRIAQASRAHSQDRDTEESGSGEGEEEMDSDDDNAGVATQPGDGSDSAEDDEGHNADDARIPAKRKQPAEASARKKKTRAPVDESDDDLNVNVAPPEPEAIPRISYTITTFSVDELKKPATRRKPKSQLIDLASDMEWVNARAHLKIAICDLLFPHHAIVEDNNFEMTWTIPRLVTHALSLNTDADYKQLIKNALKSKDPAAKISVEELRKELLENQDENVPPLPAPVPNEQNVAPIAAQKEAPPKPKTKSKIRREADILPGNLAINEKIKQLRGRWECNMSTCSSELCFIPADGPHYFLSHDHIEKWAAAILAGSATLEHPPNAVPFDAISTKTIASKSPLLQARLNSMAKDKGPQAPVFQVVLPNNPFGMYPALPGHGDHGYGNGVFPAPPALPALPPPPPVLNSSALIPVNYIEGVKLNLAAFCAHYTLSDTIKQRLADNEITGTHAFAHLTDENLKEMGFKIGQVIDLKEAIKEWARKSD